MFIDALYILVPNKKKPNCLWIGEWRNKFWHIHIVKYYSGNKKEWATDTRNNMDIFQEYDGRMTGTKYKRVNPMIPLI